MTAYLHAFGKYVPERVVPNAELAGRLGLTAERMEQASGIRERRWAGPGETIADMGLVAARDCLARAGVAAESLGMLIVASGSGARGFPGPAAEIAHRLGMGTVPALDVPVASAGSLFGLALAMQLVGMHGDTLVVATEKMSAVVGGDPNTAMLFGDGAGAALVSAREGRWMMLDAVLHSDGQYRDDLAFDGTELRMNGLNVILHASRKIPGAIEEVLAKQGIAPGDVRAFLLHQANLNLLTRVAKALGVARERIFTNLERYGNTSSASMLIATAEWAETRSEPGPVVFGGFGAGFHWGAIVAEGR